MAGVNDEGETLFILCGNTYKTNGENETISEFVFQMPFSVCFDDITVVIYGSVQDECLHVALFFCSVRKSFGVGIVSKRG